jgi:uncharacterized damage-inducible protein DinB
MRRTALVVVLTACGMVALGAAADAQMAAAPPASPAEANKRAFFFVWDDAAEKIVALAKAIPAEKYDWRPAAGVRSVAEGFQHIAGGVYYLTMMMGVQPPDGHPQSMADAGALEQQTSKEAVLASLDRALAFGRRVVDGATPEQLGKAVNFFGSEVDGRTVLLVLNAHLHEHLGQEIAYARAIGVVPPWSAAPAKSDG